MATTVSIKSLLEAGVHFGHQTLLAVDEAYTFLNNLAAQGKKVLFVGTKKQAQEPVKVQAERAGMPYVNYRWMGGMLTNFQTIRTRVRRMEEIEGMIESGVMATLPKKEQAVLNKELAKLQAALGGIRDMGDLPAAIFVVDTKHEENAIKEAIRLHIPVIGLIDTNADPDEVDFGIPANDDAIRSVNLLCTVAADAIIAGTGVEVTEAEMTAEATTEEAAE